MFEKASIILVAACVCALPARASAFTCENACDNDLVVGERIPVGARGVLMLSWGDWMEEDTSADWSVKLERRQADGSYAVVPHTLETVPWIGAMVRPDQMSVGDVFRVETAIDESNMDCEVANKEPVVHEFEVVETPALRGFDWLTVEPAVVTSGLRSDFDPESGGDETPYLAKSSYVRAEVALPPEFAGLEGTIRVEFHLDGRLMLGNPYVCHPTLHWTWQRVVDGVVSVSYDALCEALDDQGRESGELRGPSDVGMMRARVFVPGTELEWWSDEEPFSFACDQPLAIEGGDVGSGADAGRPEGDAGVGDVGHEVDGGGSSGQGGGGCAQGGGRAPAPLGWLGLSVALGWFVRRRR